MPYRPPLLELLTSRNALLSRSPRPSYTQISTPTSYHRTFTTTSTLHQEEDNFYTTLETTPSATPAQLKKQFYALSKKYHPDLHPNDAEASQRFIRISTAWATLSQPGKRAVYDRDLMRSDPSAFIGQHQQQHYQQGGSNNAARTATWDMPAGSHTSAQAYGARPASGLSRRRGQFRGPPPSFYRSGGWGANEEKRRAAAEGAEEGARRATSSGGGGFSPGQGQGHADFEVPHFDRESHFQRQENVQQVLKRRRVMWAAGRSREQEADQSGSLARLVMVSASIAIAASGAWVWEKVGEKRIAKVR